MTTGVGATAVGVVAPGTSGEAGAMVGAAGTAMTGGGVGALSSGACIWLIRRENCYVGT